MKVKHSIVTAAAAIAVASLSSPALASQDIPWTWNSGDHDSKGQFLALGEHFQGVEYSGSDYLDYEYQTYTGLRWQIPGTDDKTVKDLQVPMPEGKYVGLQVCESKTGLPDDCSAWKHGVS